MLEADEEEEEHVLKDAWVFGFQVDNKIFFWKRQVVEMSLDEFDSFSPWEDGMIVVYCR